MIPDDVVFQIKSFVFVKCDECKKEKTPKETLQNITTTYYRSIFDDDFPFPRIYKTYKYICKNCIKNLKKNNIAPLINS